MATASGKYHHRIISMVGVFIFVTNAVILVSGENYEPLQLIDYGDGLDFPMCARRSSNESSDNTGVDFTKKNSPNRLPSYYCPMTEKQRENIINNYSDKTRWLVASAVYEKCEQEVEPSLEMVVDVNGRREGCGLTRYSEFYKVGYHVSTLNATDEDEEQSDEHTKYRVQSDDMKELYRFCFEKANPFNFISYIEYRMISPTLLQNDALQEERIFEYTSNFTDNMFGDINFYHKDLEKEIGNKKYSFDAYMPGDPGDESVPTALAPPEDIPFRILRKPFFHILNTEIMSREVRKEWNKIGTYIRNKAIQQLGQVKIVTGYSIIKKENGKQKILISFDSDRSTIVWKLVYTEKEHFAMAIIFHNPRGGFSWRRPPVKICERDLCKEYGWTNMIPDHLKNFIYCCEPDVITKAISRLKDALPLRLRENFKSYYHFSESECGDRNLQGDSALINIYDGSNKLPVCARKLFQTNEWDYTAPISHEQNEYYCPATTEAAYYILETDKDRRYDNCLFKNPGKYPYCDRPVQPILIPNAKIANQGNRGCGSGNLSSRLYRMTYQVNSFEYPEPIYTVCYEHIDGKTAYIEYRIHSPRLLKNSLLAKERNFDEELKTDSYNIFFDDFEKLRNNYDNSPRDPTDFPMTKNYLVPPEDLAFRVWKRAAFHYINVKLMWPYWVNVWDSINQYLRHLAMELFWEMEIKTGVLYEDDPWQKSVWWKLIHVGTQKAIAIILHNVPLDTVVEKLCATNVCEKFQWGDMIPANGKGYVYCCSPDVITEKLGMDNFSDVLDRDYALKVANEYRSRALLCENIPVTPVTESHTP